ncbi:MAG: cupredoxin domain-containing protein [Chloroflexi bacterium]|nr:cupredoxin domain-containing protein [Chloroflexota bacterium]
MRGLGLLLIAGAVLLAGACGGGQEGEATITIHYSAFQPQVLEVPAGQPVTITLRNDDPIAHEWIVGTPDVHDVHRVGTEPFHGDVSTEVTIPAFTTLETTLTFTEPGEYAFICHLPGHEAYGMAGTLRVVDA